MSAKGFRSPVRYVANALANAALATTDPATGEKTGLTVEDYNSYIWKTHAEIAGSYDNWAGWDHWMDQHIGLKYVGSDSCAVSHQLNANLTARGVAVGQRTTADYGAEKAIHWYTGYAGSRGPRSGSLTRRSAGGGGRGVRGPRRATRPTPAGPRPGCGAPGRACGRRRPRARRRCSRPRGCRG